MEPDTSDQAPKWYRFTLARLLIGVTLIAVLFAVAGVPNTIFLAGWLAALAMYFAVAHRFGPTLAIFVFLFCLALLAFAMQTIHYSFR